jgi:hypothetical protein
MLTGIAATGGLAMINSLGNLGVWLARRSTIKGRHRQRQSWTLIPGGGSTAICVVLVGQDRRLERIPTRR